jgi:hypothetical protein
MPDDVEGSFDGGGSVRWEVVVAEDDDRRGSSVPVEETGRKSKGVDKRAGTYFRVLLKAPEEEPARQQFLDQFAPWVQGDTVEVRLPLSKTQAKQIRVKWDGDSAKKKPVTSR